MYSALSGMSGAEVNLLLSITRKLTGPIDANSSSLRRGMLEDIMHLLKSDFIASYVWNPENEIFEDEVYINMTPSNIASYGDYFQFHDPITRLLQQRKRATPVCDVMPQKELEKTEFFNDFLFRDGLHHGVNAYAYDGDLNIGDLRIWRKKGRPEFGKRECLLLDITLPYFTNALKNLRLLSRVRGLEGLWHSLLEDLRFGLLLFDASGRLLFRNRIMEELEKELQPARYSELNGHIRSLVAKRTASLAWNEFSLSILRASPPGSDASVTAVIVSRSPSLTITPASLSRRFTLSEREAQVCTLIIKGLTDGEIASVLGIALFTVRTHLKHVFAKLDVSKRSELVYRLMEGLAPPQL
jgi:DNA-binding CsgD family transcriptional regulator/PAS domain-containing protein